MRKYILITILWVLLIIVGWLLREEREESWSIFAIWAVVMTVSYGLALYSLRKSEREDRY